MSEKKNLRHVGKGDRPKTDESNKGKGQFLK